MAFESGALTLSMYSLPDGLPSDYVSRFAAQALPPVDALGREPVHGWVTGRHLLDREVNDDTAHVAGRLRLTLVKAERKIPEALLRAECKMQELAALAVEGKAFLDRRARAEIRKEVTDRLWPAMPPTLTGIPIVFDFTANVLYAGAASARQMDVLSQYFREATGRDPVPIVPETAALRRRRISVRDLAPTSFSPECDDETAGGGVGTDFLTWLWFHFEERGGTLTLDGRPCGVMIEGPLTFFMEGSGAHLTVLRDGEPLLSSEAKAALLAGKKLRRAKVTLAHGDESWSAMVDADTFVFRGLNLAKGTTPDPVSRFEERMLSLERFRQAFFAFFDRFIDERTDRGRWQQARPAIHAWVAGRVAKA